MQGLRHLVDEILAGFQYDIDIYTIVDNIYIYSVTVYRWAIHSVCMNVYIYNHIYIFIHGTNMYSYIVQICMYI